MSIAATIGVSRSLRRSDLFVDGWHDESTVHLKAQVTPAESERSAVLASIDRQLLRSWIPGVNA